MHPIQKSACPNQEKHAPNQEKHAPNPEKPKNSRGDTNHVVLMEQEMPTGGYQPCRPDGAGMPTGGGSALWWGVALLVPCGFAFEL